MELNTNNNERRNQSRNIINNMLNERRKMLVQLCEVSGLKPFEGKISTRESLQIFCQTLVDYIASAHFGLYERIAEGKERRKSVIRAAEKTYPLISASTEAAIEFNERYEQLDPGTIETYLQKDISKLGEILSTRIEYEDQVIAAMINESQQLAEPA